MITVIVHEKSDNGNCAQEKSDHGDCARQKSNNGDCAREKRGPCTFRVKVQVAAACETFTSSTQNRKFLPLIWGTFKALVTSFA